MCFRAARSGVSAALAIFCAASLGYAQRYKPDLKNRLAPFVSSPQRAVDKMLDMANLKPGETLYDLGCGDGRILIAAAQKFKVKAVGIEISERLAHRAENNVKALGLENRVRVIRGDFMQTDLSPADVVTLYLITTANENLRPNLEKYLKKDARVVSYDYPIPGWKAIDEQETDPSRLGNRHTIYLYEIPTSLKK
jgi:predicted RNA methylase